MLSLFGSTRALDAKVTDFLTDNVLPEIQDHFQAVLKDAPHVGKYLKFPLPDNIDDAANGNNGDHSHVTDHALFNEIADIEGIKSIQLSPSPQHERTYLRIDFG